MMLSLISFHTVIYNNARKAFITVKCDKSRAQSRLSSTLVSQGFATGAEPPLVKGRPSPSQEGQDYINQPE